MKCTNCGLINPENAERCDCGYDFATQTVKASYLPAQRISSWKRWLPLLTAPAIFVAIGPLIGYFSGFVIQSIVMGEVSDFSARDLRLLVGWVPVAYFVGSLPALCTGIVYAMVSLILPHKILGIFFWRAILGGVIGAISTRIFCQLSGLSTDLVLWAGLPAGAICGLLSQNRRPNAHGSDQT